MANEVSVVDYQARQDIAVLRSDQAAVKEALNGIRDILNHILTAILVAIAGAAGASIWNLVILHKP